MSWPERCVHFADLVPVSHSRFSENPVSQSWDEGNSASFLQFWASYPGNILCETNLLTGRFALTHLKLLLLLSWRLQTEGSGRHVVSVPWRPSWCRRADTTQKTSVGRWLSEPDWMFHHSLMSTSGCQLYQRKTGGGPCRLSFIQVVVVVIQSWSRWAPCPVHTAAPVQQRYEPRLKTTRRTWKVSIRHPFSHCTCFHVTFLVIYHIITCVLAHVGRPTSLPWQPNWTQVQTQHI